MPPYQILCSFHYFKKKGDLIRECVKNGYDVFIDSGAFSAETKGVPIDIDEYCRFIKDTNVVTYAGLDVIGNAYQTMKNTEYMASKYNLSPIPTFHLGSDPADLRKLFSYDYIALGGLVFSGGRERYCDEIWSIILREKPGLRVHGFGMTNVDLMERYPWYSVDSSTYKDGRRFGRPKILWSNMEMRQLNEEDFQALLSKLHYNFVDMPNKTKWFLYDYFSVQAYKVFGEHLKDLNKTKDFSYLTAQKKMF